MVKTPAKAAYRADENIIVGNVALYGATSGTAFINGVAESGLRCATPEPMRWWKAWASTAVNT